MKDIFNVTPVEYLRDIKLRGSLFGDDSSGAVSCVYTEFYVDHKEPLEALNIFRSRNRWCLGELLDGHEFLILLPVPVVKAGTDNDVFT